MQNHNNGIWSVRRSICFCIVAFLAVTSLAACTTARKVGQGTKQAVKDGVEAVKQGGREVKRAIKDN